MYNVMDNVDHLSTYLPTHTSPTYLHITYLPTHLLTYPFTHLPTSYLPSYNLFITYLIILWWYEINMWNKKLENNWTLFDSVVYHYVGERLNS
jgi:hypothetical protein